MKFVPSIADQLDLQALHRVRGTTRQLADGHYQSDKS